MLAALPLGRAVAAVLPTREATAAASLDRRHRRRKGKHKRHRGRDKRRCLPPTQDLQAAIADADRGATLSLCAGTWALSSTLEIFKPLTVQGAGASKTVLHGGNAVRVLRILNGAGVTLQDLTITKGRASGFLFPDNSGGGIYNESGSLTLGPGSSVSGNSARVDGGGIYNERGSTLTLQATSSVAGNSSLRTGGGIFNAATGTVTLRAGSRLTGNTAGIAGGGFFNADFGTMTLAPGAIVCSNSDVQCAGSFAGTCPFPSARCVP